METTTDSFGKKLWKVNYIRCGKKQSRTFYTEEEAENFESRGVPMLKDVPFDKPKKDRRKNRAVPSW